MILHWSVTSVKTEIHGFKEKSFAKNKMFPLLMSAEPSSAWKVHMLGYASTEISVETFYF